MHSVTLSRQFGASGHGFSSKVSARLLTLTTASSIGESLTDAALGRHSPCTSGHQSASYFFTRPVRKSVAAMSAWTVMELAQEARTVLDAMAQSLLDDPSMPTPAPLHADSAGRRATSANVRKHSRPGHWQGQFS